MPLHGTARPAPRPGFVPPLQPLQYRFSEARKGLSSARSIRTGDDNGFADRSLSVARCCEFPAGRTIGFSVDTFKKIVNCYSLSLSLHCHPKGSALKLNGAQNHWGCFQFTLKSQQSYRELWTLELPKLCSLVGCNGCSWSCTTTDTFPAAKQGISKHSRDYFLMNPLKIIDLYDS